LSLRQQQPPKLHANANATKLPLLLLLLLPLKEKTVLSEQMQWSQLLRMFATLHHTAQQLRNRNPSCSEVFEFPHIRDLKIFNPNITPSGVAQPEQHRHHSKLTLTVSSEGHFCALAGLELVWTILLGRDDSALSIYTATNLAYCVSGG
jgi:hypothetical protein